MKQIVNSKNINSFKYIFLFILFIFTTSISAQNVSAVAELDSSLMFIGGQMNLKLEVEQPKKTVVAFPNFKDTIITAIETIGEPKIDTISIDDNNFKIVREYTITSFDSGLHYIPPIKLEYFDGEIKLKTETYPLALNVINPFVEVDPQKGFFDIKDGLNLPFKISELKRFIKWVLLGILLIAVAIVGYYLWTKRERPIKEIFIKQKPKEPAHIIALRELEELKSEKLWQSGDIKSYHSKITDILRRYLKDRYEFNAVEQTTNEILNALKTVDISDKELLDKIEKVFTTSDFVKFAKFSPLPDENDLSLLNSVYFVNNTKLEIVENDEEESDSEEKEIDKQ